MRLSDLFRDMQLATFGEIALLLFFGVFAGVAIRTFLLRSRGSYDRLSRLPLDDDSQEIRP
jgi:cbb3-type cytochrome oxidase subunit 3